MAFRARADRACVMKSAMIQAFGTDVDENCATIRRSNPRSSEEIFFVITGVTEVT
jgi:hypothetical protein